MGACRRVLGDPLSYDPPDLRATKASAFGNPVGRGAQKRSRRSFGALAVDAFCFGLTNNVDTAAALCGL